MDPELIKVLISSGTGGILALIVLAWKRGDDQRHARELGGIIERMENRDGTLLKIVEANTSALRSLQITVDSIVSIKHIEERLARIERN